MRVGALFTRLGALGARGGELFTPGGAAPRGLGKFRPARGAPYMGARGAPGGVRGAQPG